LSAAKYVQIYRSTTVNSFTDNKTQVLRSVNWRTELWNCSVEATGKNYEKNRIYTM